MFADGAVEYGSLTEYVERIKAGRTAVIQSEELEPRERALETLAVQLRRCEGVRASAFFDQTGFTLADVAGTTRIVCRN